MRFFLGLLVLICAAPHAAGNPPQFAETPPPDTSITTTLPPAEPALNNVEEVTVEAP